VKHEDMSFKSSIDGIQINGTFTKVSQPKGVVLFIGGSGKTDRDETADEKETFSGKKEKLFLQLSEALAKQGFSSFRYDKRGVLNEKGEVNKDLWLTADRSHLISDAIDAAKFAVSNTSLQYSDLIILGHSEGTIVAVESAISINENLRGLILLGAQARSMKDMLYYQIVESQDATKSGQNANPIDDYKMALEMITTSKEDWAPDNKPMNWYREFIVAPANQDRVHLVKAQISIFQGAEDYSTPHEEVERFKKLGLKNITTKVYENLGHCFSPNKNGKPTYGPIDARVVEDITRTVVAFERAE